MEEKQETRYEYHYSSAQQEEIDAIRRKYVTEKPDEIEDKMVRLRRLDAGVEQIGTAWSLVVGVIGLLVFGLGMACILEWMGVWFVPGILIGLAGIAMMAVAYPLYRALTTWRRRRITPEILALTEELSK